MDLDPRLSLAPRPAQEVRLPIEAPGAFLTEVRSIHTWRCTMKSLRFALLKRVSVVLVVAGLVLVAAASPPE